MTMRTQTNPNNYVRAPRVGSGRFGSGTGIYPSGLGGGGLASVPTGLRHVEFIDSSQGLFQVPSADCS